MSKNSIHPDSPFGQLASLRATSEAKKAKADALAQKRTAELAEIRSKIKLTPTDTDNVAALADLQARERATWSLLERAEEEAAHATHELAKFLEGAALLEPRLSRLREEIALLEDETQAAPGSPIERRENLAAARYKLAVMVDDPRKAGKLRDDLQKLVRADRWQNRIGLGLLTFERDVRTLAGLSRSTE